MSTFDKKSLETSSSGACGDQAPAPSDLAGAIDTGFRGHASGTVCTIPTPGACNSS
jgi:hypothetical protein